MAFFGRGKNKYEAHLTTRQIYFLYKKEVEKDSMYDVSVSKFGSVCADFNDALLRYLIDHGTAVKLPGRFGKLRILSNQIEFGKKDSIPIDFKKSVELKKRIFLFNEHSDGKVYKIRWEKGSLTNRTFFGLVLNRKIKRYFAQKILNNEIRA